MKCRSGLGSWLAPWLRSPSKPKSKSPNQKRRSIQAGCQARWNTASSGLVLVIVLVMARGLPCAADPRSAASEEKPANGVTAAQTGHLVRAALNAEGSLLHRRLDLSAVLCWDRKGRSWQPLGRQSERLLVVNLWSAHCAPCIDELPLLRRMTAAWSRERDVRFLFIADPPHDTEAPEVIAFWSQHSAAVPDADPCRSTSDRLRATLDNGTQPLTLLVDEEGVVRQAFIGAVQERGLASAMERLLRALGPTPRRPR